jgi:hypothetical protein
MNELTRAARLEASQGDPEPVRDGINRPTSDDPFLWQRKPAWSRATEEEVASFERHSWQAAPGDWIAYSFESPQQVEQITLVLDSNLERGFKPPNSPQDLPPNMPKSFTIEIKAGGSWGTFYSTSENYLRWVKIPVQKTVEGIRMTIEELYAAETTELYGFHIS